MSIYYTYIVFIVCLMGLIFQPFKVKEVYWAIAGAILMVIGKSVSLNLAIISIFKGNDVYFFLIGMMLLSCNAKEEGLFEYFSYKALLLSKGSGKRLFTLLFFMGVIVTMFLSNDATAVVLTAAVIVVMKSANTINPLPYLYVCAFVANAASFILPISNPANLVIFGTHLPSLPIWTILFCVPSAISIISTFYLLRWIQRKHIPETIQYNANAKTLSSGAKISLGAIAFTCIVLIICSICGISMGLPTLAVGVFATIVQLFTKRNNPFKILKQVQWSVIIMVAGLFVMVAGLYQTGLVTLLANNLGQITTNDPKKAVWISGFIAGIGSNIANNLPVGLISQDVIHSSGIHNKNVISAILVGVDLGPNISISGSLASILWLSIIRKAGIKCSGFEFLKIGLVVTIIPLVLCLWWFVAIL